MFEGEGGAMERPGSQDGGQPRRFLVQKADQIRRGKARFRFEGAGALGVDDPFVDLVNLVQVEVEILEEAFSRDDATGFAGRHAAGGVDGLERKGVRLAIVFELQPMLEMAKELVSAGEAAVFDRREEFLVA